MKFPIREDYRIEEDILESDTGICDCGHADFIHKNVDEQLRDPNNKFSQFGECVICMCPSFSLQHSMKHREYLRVNSFDERRKVGSVE